MLTNKIDFAVTIKVDHANPNGDINTNNRPRITYDGFGEISDVCIKRKIRDRLLEKYSESRIDGDDILYQADSKKIDDCKSIKARLNNVYDLDLVCKKYLDVRAFGVVLAFAADKDNKSKSKGKGKVKKVEAEVETEVDVEDNSDVESATNTESVSKNITGPVSISPAFSLDPIEIEEITICSSANKNPPTKNNNSETSEGRSSDTIGSKYRVTSGVYLFHGSMNVELSKKTLFSDQDMELVKEAILKLFENDSSTARPAGSMKVVNMIWLNHNCKSGKCSTFTFKEKTNKYLDKSTGHFDIDNIQNEFSNQGVTIEKIEGF